MANRKAPTKTKLQRLAWLPAIFFCVAVAILFLNRHKAGPAVQTDRAPATLAPNFETHRVKKNSFSSRALSAAAMPVADSDATADENERACWAKIDEHIQLKSFVIANQQNLDDVIGSWFFDKEKKPTSKESTIAGKFMMALAKAGLLDGRTSNEPSDDEAIALLNEVAEDDPSNSAPLLYTAIIEERRGNTQAVAELMERIRDTNRFESYLTDISHSLFSFVQTSSDLMQAYAIWSQLPIPNLMALKEFLKRRNNVDVAKQMMAKGLDTKASLAEIDWISVEYAIGRAIMANEGLPTLKELYDEKSPANFLGGESIVQTLRELCDVSALDEKVTLLKEHLNSHR